MANKLPVNYEDFEKFMESVNKHVFSIWYHEYET